MESYGWAGGGEILDVGGGEISKATNMNDSLMQQFFALPYVQENAVIGMDFQVNDAMGNEYYMDKPIGREAIVAWSDHTGNAFRYVDRFGDMKLIKK